MNPFLASCLSIGLDYGSFKYAQSQRPIEEVNPAVFNQEIIKSSECITVGILVHKLEKKDKKKAKIVKIGLFLINGLLAVHNIREANK